MNDNPETVEKQMNIEPIKPGLNGQERRSQADRRAKPTSPWGAFPPAGRRMYCRRKEEHRRPYFVDRFSPGLLAVILMLIAASLLDAVFTMQLLAAGGAEINPLMCRLLTCGELAFLSGKYLLTVVGLPLLLVFKNFYLFGTSIRVVYLIPAVVVLYVLLISYQLLLMWQHMWS